MRASALRAVSWTFITIGLAAVATVLLYHRGFLVWDPSVYYFSRIPSSLDLNTVVTTMIGGVVFSIVGAAIPAARAADTDPVKSLRYE
jgi:lipoprotein-releasing system permease protein